MRKRYYYYSVESDSLLSPLLHRNIGTDKELLALLRDYPGVPFTVRRMKVRTGFSYTLICMSDV